MSKERLRVFTKRDTKCFSDNCVYERTIILTSLSFWKLIDPRRTKKVLFCIQEDDAEKKKCNVFRERAEKEPGGDRFLSFVSLGTLRDDELM